MQSLDRNGYNEDQIRDMLLMKNGSRVVKFRYDLLDRDERKKGELNRVLSGEVSMSAFSTIKRTAKFVIQDETIETRSYFSWSDFGDMTWNQL